MEEVVEVLLNELPEKRGDPGSITVPCQFGNIMTTRALNDSRVSINIMLYSLFQRLNLPSPKPIHMKIHLADKRIIHLMGVCEDLLIKVDKLVFPVDFIILDMEEDLKVPIILGRPFLNTACALVDMRECTLTLKVGDESVIFEADQKDTQEESREEKVSPLDLDDELLEKELVYLQESDPNQFFLSLNDNSNAKGDLDEIERMINEADYQESIKSIQSSPTRRVVRADSASTLKKFKSGATFILQPISSLTESNVQLLLDHFENLIEENEVMKDVVNFGNAHLALLETIMGGDEVVQEKNKGSLEGKGDPKAGDDDSHHSSIESPMLDQEEVLTKRQRAKPRAIVSNMFEVLTFTTPDSIMNK
uniref:Aspartic peptidase DDI1-type domain-containing protein n=1 Tax=Lactuca sativa TaxID=4236 RepID=A0A9R1V6E3_LACSA|nr:hypothetical protein LSAT_V11C600316800 [Lactuca sativa]